MCVCGCNGLAQEDLPNTLNWLVIRSGSHVYVPTGAAAGPQCRVQWSGLGDPLETSSDLLTPCSLGHCHCVCNDLACASIHSIHLLDFLKKIIYFYGKADQIYRKKETERKIFHPLQVTTVARV